jgi:lactate permease
MFTQILDPTGNLFVTWLVALIPVLLLLFLLAGLRMSAWLAVLIGSIVTFLLALFVWRMPLGDGALAFLYGSATGIWYVDWITFWGVMLFNTLVTTGSFEKLRRWLVQQGTRDVRVQTILFAWAFGALLEGLVGFGYPWAFVAPILIAIGIPDLDAIRVAAIANNAPVSYGALGAPIIALATVTAGTLGVTFAELLPLYSASVGKIVAILALLPPWILLYLVSGGKGMWSAWPLAIVGSLGYIAGQLPTAVYLGPYLPDIIGSIVCFAALLVLLRVWRPAQVLGYGGGAVTGDTQAEAHGLSSGDVGMGWLPIAILIAVVVAWTGPWSKLPTIVGLHLEVAATSGLPGGAPVRAIFNWTPFVAGTAILASWIITVIVLRVKFADLRGSLLQNLVANVGGLPRWYIHLWARLCLQLFRHGGVAGERVLQARRRLHCRCAAAWLHRRRAVGKQHLDQRHVRHVPGLGRQGVGFSVTPLADTELGRGRDRQADRAADRERRCLHQPVRPQ